MRVGTIVIKKSIDEKCPNDCIEVDGSWHTKDDYPELYDMFKDCKCLRPYNDNFDAELIEEPTVKGIFHLPNSHGKAWLVYKD